MATVRVAAVQVSSGPDRHENLAATAPLVGEAAGRGAELVVLPELVAALGPRAALVAATEPFDGPTLEWSRGLAADHRVWLVAGSFVEQHEDGRRTNTSCLVAPDGEVAAVYRKVHLFDVTVPGAELRESDTFTAGDTVVVADHVTSADIGLGLAICYDLRFPELFRILVLGGATVVALPAAFTATTGAAHWELLVRARAVEDQCFVVAAGQCGRTAGRLAWHGHSMIVDPWGRILAEAADQPGVIDAELDLDELVRIRRDLPSLANRRPAAYRWPADALTTTGPAEP